MRGECRDMFGEKMKLANVFLLQIQADCRVDQGHEAVDKRRFADIV